MIPELLKRLPAAALAAAFVAAQGLTQSPPAAAAIETDPAALYAAMKKAYDEGSSKAWPFSSELYYQTTIFDAGRAYSLFRPTDPNYADVAELAVDVATMLHYNPLTNDDASLWYVLESANYVAKNGDPEHVAKANDLLARLQQVEDDPAALARQAEDDALQDARQFRGDGDALVYLVVADLRAFNLTRDVTYRSAMLQHAADPIMPLVRVPDPEFGEMFSIASSALTDPGFSDEDRAAARTIEDRRAHTPELKLIARVSAIPHELRLTRTAPADEYFGALKYSPLGVRNEVVRINRYLDKGWGDRMEEDALHVDDAVEDWQRQYPHDTTLPRTLLDAYQLLHRLQTDKTKAAAERLKMLLLVQYAASRQAQELASS